MKNFNALLTGLLLILAACQQQKLTPFDQHFTNGSLRIDYFHIGDAKTETVAIDQIYSYNTWAGSLTNLIDQLNYGAYYYKIYDQASEEVIYSKGFDSYFKEYQVSRPALEGQVKQFHESAIIPFPKKKIIFVLEKRNASGSMDEVFRRAIDPKQAVEKPFDPDVRVYTGLESGDPNTSADIAIIGEGYTADEDQKFQDDLKRFTEVFFRAEPCKSNKSKFNIRGVLKPSVDSGIDEPRAGIDKNTAVNASFNTMGSERYVLTEDNRALRDIAGHAPYDALYIMVNHSRYGGGGIYNFYCVYTSDNIDSDYLMVHEFGHSFFGLADEYYTSSTAYNDFYSADYEPNEPNITALKDPEQVKWKHLVSDSMSIPTPWSKSKFDSLDLIWQKQRAQMNDAIAALQKNGASEKEITEAKAQYDKKSTERNTEVQAYLEGSQFAGKVGAFEGAGYASTGLYRSSVNCIMFTRTDYFCPVCQEAMVNVISSYSD
ncbi:MAG: M64 family metallopeptidase [Reichenbachiella sp.]|uniref:M64 family metallopeptidase n=1 Tax=Reichenbachiella sp. TaxID=2184521 RepID=UPI0032676C4D